MSTVLEKEENPFLRLNLKESFIVLKRHPYFWKDRLFVWRSVRMEPIFWKNFQFGDICAQNRPKIAQVAVFGHFLDFASLVLLDFEHSDRWASGLVVYLQFAGPVNVFFLENSKLI